MRRYTRPLAPEPRHRSVSALLVVVAALAIGGVVRWAQLRNSTQPTTATLRVQRGEATVLRADAASGPPVKAGGVTTLQRGDEVRTTQDARATLSFGDNEATELQGQVRVSVIELHRSQMTRALVAVLALHEGRTYARLRPTLLQGLKFEIETPVATVVVRGTVFQCDVLDKARVYVAVSEGIVSISMGEQSLELQPGQAADVRLGQPLVAIDGVVKLPAAEPEAASTAESLRKGAQTSGMVTVTATVSVPKVPTLTSREKTLFPPASTPTQRADDMALYTVKPGDTLSSIARQHGISLQALSAANRDSLKDPEVLRTGQQLRIPRP